MNNYNKKINEFIELSLKNKYHDFLKNTFHEDKDDKRYFEMFLIRSFENKLLDAFTDGHISGTTHTYIGQECNSVALFENINQDDIIWSNHRCHGHFISYCGKVQELMAEIFGKSNGICKGRGGSQHLNYKNFFSNGILGGSVPQAVGSAFSLKKNDKKRISICFIGDGTLGEGVLYESLNLSSLWECPILYVCENNFIAQTTPINQNLAGSIKDRVLSFSIKYQISEKFDFDDILKKGEDLIQFVRNERKPAFFEILSNRLGPHSKGDDTRNDKFLEEINQRDVIKNFKKKIKSSTEIENLANNIIEEIFSNLIK